ncbi:hypothetical protein PTTG_29108 [Puccinia triticina 1-1 BBBD Race 1]|uniref:Uncharacterized protein n=1 Tax=Puccinia triticina (isolate 1-1 / race 1 (BBBD)) TaxID=630390 RepID=A0A180G6J8_PUCT1|nr:hypothetical protein PTTG_29108 [Puccinia triticina 1-1 BBBD Race 1]
MRLLRPKDPVKGLGKLLPTLWMGARLNANNQSGACASSDSSSGNSYALRLRKKALYSEEDSTNDSDDKFGSDDTVTGRQTRRRVDILPVDSHDSPRLLPEELDIVRRTILHTILPSWIDRVPRNLGSASHGSLKAAEWLIMYKVFYTIALIPHWVTAHKNTATEITKRRISVLLESTTTLSQVAHFLTLPKISVQDLDELNSLILKYRQCLQHGWPAALSKPNLHLTQHFSEVIRRFGPPRLTAAWAQERVNGMLQRLSTNHRLDEIPKTLLNKWHINSNLRSLQHDPTYATSSVQEEIEGEGSITLKLAGPLFLKWKRAVACTAGTSPSLMMQSDLNLDPTVNCVKSINIDWKKFTKKQHHKGNSLVEFYLGKDQRFGETEEIFRSTQTPSKTWLVVKPFKELHRTEDPYGNYPNLNCRLVLAEFEMTTVIDSDRIIGHMAMLRHAPGTFGLSAETISAVGLRTAVRLPLVLF